MVFYSTSEGSIGLGKALDEALSGVDHKLAIEHRVGAYPVALLQLAVGTPDAPETDQSGFAFNVPGVAPGAGVCLEAHPGFAVAVEGDDIAGMQGGGFRAAVHLGADPVDA